MIVKAAMQRRREALGLEDGEGNRLTDLRVKIVPTVIIGALGGLIVGMTSVGSGSIIIVSLLFLYPRLTSPSLVGTDLVQAVPLVASAALAHILFGDFSAGLTVSILVGSIPGVYIGARMSSRSPDAVVRKALIFVLLASGLKLVNVSTVALGWIMGTVAVVWFLVPFVLHKLGVRDVLNSWLRRMGAGAARRGAVLVPARVRAARASRADAVTREPTVEVDL
jgi:hypothetical protein